MKLKIGKWLFLYAMIGAVLIGLLEGLGVFSGWEWSYWVLAVIGIVIAFLNIKVKERMAIMLSALVLSLTSGALLIIPSIGGTLDAIMGRVASLAIPIAIIIAFMELYSRAKN